MEGVSEHLVAVGGSAGLITSVSVLHTEWNIASIYAFAGWVN